jgi:hypothetical protein
VLIAEGLAKLTSAIAGRAVGIGADGRPLMTTGECRRDQAAPRDWAGLGLFALSTTRHLASTGVFTINTAAR